MIGVRFPHVSQRRSNELTTKKIEPPALKARILRVADGTRTAAEIARELGINERQLVAHSTS
jgi:hypothetical protein